VLWLGLARLFVFMTTPQLVFATLPLRAPVAKRDAEHSMAGQEDGLEIARDEGASRGVVQET
jgi:hypothetical protein